MFVVTAAGTHKISQIGISARVLALTHIYNNWDTFSTIANLRTVVVSNPFRLM